MSLQSKYAEAKPVGVLGLTNSSALVILGIENGIDDFVICQVREGKSKVGKVHKLKLHEAMHKGTYFILAGTRYYLADFMRV